MFPLKSQLDRLPAARFASIGTVLLLVLAAVIPYLNTFQIPWYFDDVNNIVDNPLVRDLLRTLRSLFEKRGVAIFTFALNHRFGGLEVGGYHLVNLIIHSSCVVAVWLLLRRLLKSSLYWPVFGALLFAVHPVQTQAVTYVVQRMTSLSALFFILAVYGYLLFLDGSGRQRLWLYSLSLLSGVLAVLTKENTAVLPLLLLLVERYFHPGRLWRQQLTSLLPFTLAPAWKTVEMLLLPIWRGEVESSLRYADQLQSLQNITPMRYLFTEFSVHWYYIKLLFFPAGQMLDYGWPVVETLLTVQNLSALAGLIALAGAAWVLRQRRPLLSFGIVWFFITLSVESSFIPLDPIFEHRLYLPMFGFALVVLDLLRPFPWRKGGVALLAVILSLLAVLTWQRNALWGDMISFMEDNLRRSPDNVRVMVMLGNAYASDKRPEDGLRMIERAMQFNPRYDFAYTALGKILIDREEGARAIPPLLQGLELNPNSVTLNEYLGIAYGQTGDLRRALSHFQRALELNPQDASIYTNIGVVHSWLGDNRQAADFFEQSLELAPDSEKTLFNYASTLFSLGEKSRALDSLRALVKINAANVDAQYGLGALAFEFGHYQETVVARDALRRLGDAERAGELDGLLQQMPMEKKR